MITGIRCMMVAVLLAPWWCGLLHGQGETRLAVAILSLPAGSDGLLHWRDGKSPSEPVQLSIRYFSEPLKLKSEVISFYAEPIAGDPAGAPPVEPLVMLKIPQNSGLNFVVLTGVPGRDGKTQWKSQLIPGRDLGVGTMKLFNGTDETLGIQLPKKNVKLNAGKSMDFDSSAWPGSFPVKIYQLETRQKMVFSSVWRLNDKRRELCFLYKKNNNIALRSLLFLTQAGPQRTGT
jgi:hypothetical protein